MNNDFPVYLNDTVQRSCTFLTVDDGTDPSDTTHLLPFIRNVNDKFDIIISLFCVEVTKGIAGVYLYERLTRTLERHTLSRNKLIGVTTERS
jgi:hypothetical protein